MAYLTRQQLRAYGSGSTYLKRAQESLRKSISPDAATVFLSHSHQDRETIEAAIVLLGNQGIAVYVDWQDPTMPTVTSSQTALTLKQRIVQCGKFVLLASEHAVRSQWVPWELGFADGAGGLADIAILPFKDSGTDWTRVEYLGLYPWVQIATSRDGTREDLAVFFPDGQEPMWLSSWLAIRGDRKVLRP